MPHRRLTFLSFTSAPDCGPSIWVARHPCHTPSPVVNEDSAHRCGAAVQIHATVCLSSLIRAAGVSARLLRPRPNSRQLDSREAPVTRPTRCLNVLVLATIV